MPYKDNRGYEREHTDLVHRNRAYHIYLQNRKKYPLPYSAYEVHHKDFDKTNNEISNLQILTPTEHDKIHKEHEEESRKIREKYIQQTAEEEALANEEAIKKKTKLVNRNYFLFGSILILLGIISLIFNWFYAYLIGIPFLILGILFFILRKKWFSILAGIIIILSGIFNLYWDIRLNLHSWYGLLFFFEIVLVLGIIYINFRKD